LLKDGMSLIGVARWSTIARWRVDKAFALGLPGKLAIIGPCCCWRSWIDIALLVTSGLGGRISKPTSFLA
jgi:hypothetical protein